MDYLQTPVLSFSAAHRSCALYFPGGQDRPPKGRSWVGRKRERLPYGHFFIEVVC